MQRCGAGRKPVRGGGRRGWWCRGSYAVQTPRSGVLASDSPRTATTRVLTKTPSTVATRSWGTPTFSSAASRYELHGAALPSAIATHHNPPPPPPPPHTRVECTRGKGGGQLSGGPRETNQLTASTRAGVAKAAHGRGAYTWDWSHQSVTAQPQHSHSTADTATAQSQHILGTGRRGCSAQGGAMVE